MGKTISHVIQPQGLLGLVTARERHRNWLQITVSPGWLEGVFTIPSLFLCIWISVSWELLLAELLFPTACELNTSGTFSDIILQTVVPVWVESPPAEIREFPEVSEVSTPFSGSSSALDVSPPLADNSSSIAKRKMMVLFSRLIAQVLGKEGISAPTVHLTRAIRTTNLLT